MEKAKVFISSTIYDFKDLRSALKYWLTELGYEVQLSETNDFDADTSLNSYEACLKNIEACDYFILLIGSRVGGWYDPDKKTSITQAEYRKAYELAGQNKIRLISFVRKEIYDIREDRKELAKYLEECDSISKEDRRKITYHPSKFINDAEFIINFINEVSRNSEQKNAISGKIALPKANWIFQFNNFEDIIISLKNQLNIKISIQYKVHSDNTIRELLTNLTTIHMKMDAVILPDFYLVSPFRGKVPQDLKQEFKLKVEELKNIHINMLMVMTMDYMSNINIRAALTAGVFYEYNSEKDIYEPSIIHVALQKLDDEIYLLNKIKKLIESDDFGNFSRQILNLYDSEKDDKEIDIDLIKFPQLFTLFMLHDRQSNIIKLTKYILKCFWNPEKEHDFPELFDRLFIKASGNTYIRPTKDEIEEYYMSELK